MMIRIEMNLTNFFLINHRETETITFSVTDEILSYRWYSLCFINTMFKFNTELLPKAEESGFKFVVKLISWNLHRPQHLFHRGIPYGIWVGGQTLIFFQYYCHLQDSGLLHHPGSLYRKELY